MWIGPMCAPAEKGLRTGDHIASKRRSKRPAESSPHESQVTLGQLVLLLHPMRAHQRVFANRHRKRITVGQLEDMVRSVTRGHFARLVGLDHSYRVFKELGVIRVFEITEDRILGLTHKMRRIAGSCVIAHGIHEMEFRQKSAKAKYAQPGIP